MPIRKILIANRGEIAIRVARTCREMGLATVAIFSDADRAALHVRSCDQALRVGPPASRESYLVIDAVLAAAKQSGADAIHPGYGFLSEKAAFARACRVKNIIFIGPPPEAMDEMGVNTRARRKADAAGVPIVPGLKEPLADTPEGVAFGRKYADEIGYPIMLKAAAGGGGKGMRLVTESKDFDNSLATAQREAKSAFGDDAVYVEKYIVGPRHVEIQIFGDHHGTMLHLGERECSVQRRHQKMIEEAPSIAVSPELRARMGAAAVAAATKAGYVNAGTCEFLLDAKGDFYFLEMNTRIQVEHPVTELVTGVDLVQWQIRVAAGEKLPFTQAELVPRGWAIECRITSEDPANGFLPSTGKISFLHLPSGPGVRWDGGIEAGSEVSLFYDPMLAKLIVWARTREQAIERMHRALLELTIEGVDTSRDFHLRMMENEDFRRGDIDIQWLEKHLAELTSVRPPAEGIVRAAIAAVLLAERDRSAPRRANGGVRAAPGAAGASSGSDSGGANGAWLRAARLEGLR